MVTVNLFYEIQEVCYLEFESYVLDSKVQLSEMDYPCEAMLILDPRDQEVGDFLFSRCFFLKFHSTVLGYACVAVDDSSHLQRLYIDPRFRGCGYSKFLLEHLRIKSLYVLSGNTTAIRLYEQFGFIKQESRCFSNLLRYLKSE